MLAGFENKQMAAANLTRHVSFCSEAVNVPMIPLGLKETKEVDVTVAIKVKSAFVQVLVLFKKICWV